MALGSFVSQQVVYFFFGHIAPENEKNGSLAVSIDDGLRLASLAWFYASLHSCSSVALCRKHSGDLRFGIFHSSTLGKAAAHYSERGSRS
jgi:hypothetical protein